MVAVPARHPLLAHKYLPLEEVLHYPLVLGDPHACEGFARQVDRILRRVDREPIVAEWVASIDLMMALVSAGFALGLAGTSQIVASREPGIVARPLAGRAPMLTTYLLRSDNEPSQVLARFIERVSNLESLAAKKATVELQCAARDHVPLRTRAGVVSMTELVRATMRLRPDRVIVGEVRGGEALDLIKVWGTGHPGGIATIHAGSALGALLRLEQLILEVAVNPPRALVAEAVNVVIHIAGRGRKRRIESIARVVGFDGVGYRLTDALEPSLPELPFPSPDPAGELP
ncbi:type II/IV secretion system family protein [Burkholderia thailandensis E254]|nr:type II/IV secretion system family protein [Burkholderia thailandensis E254]